MRRNNVELNLRQQLILAMIGQRSPFKKVPECVKIGKQIRLKDGSCATVEKIFRNEFGEFTCVAVSDGINKEDMRLVRFDSIEVSEDGNLGKASL